MAVAAAMLAPRRRISGTVITLPPTPRKAAIAPMARPAVAAARRPMGCMPAVVPCTKPGRSSASAMVRAR